MILVLTRLGSLVPVPTNCRDWEPCGATSCRAGPWAPPPSPTKTARCGRARRSQGHSPSSLATTCSTPRTPCAGPPLANRRRASSLRREVQDRSWKLETLKMMLLERRIRIFSQSHCFGLQKLNLNNILLVFFNNSP